MIQDFADVVIIVKCNLPISDEILNHIQIIEFDINRYGINMDEYFENLFNSKIIYENNLYLEGK